MTPENFTYWLKGFFEISDAKKLDEKQIDIIKDHLNLVFNKVTPVRNNIKKDKLVDYRPYIDGINISKSTPYQGSRDPHTKVIC